MQGTLHSGPVTTRLPNPRPEQKWSPRLASMIFHIPVADDVSRVQTLILYPAVFSHDSGGKEQVQPFLFLSEPSNSRNFPQITHSAGTMAPDPADIIIDENCPSVHTSCHTTYPPTP